MNYILKLLLPFFLISSIGCDDKKEDFNKKNQGLTVFIINENKILNNSILGKKTIKHINDIEAYVNDKATLTEKYYGSKGIKPSIETYNSSINVLRTYLREEKESAINIFSIKLSNSTKEWIEKHPGSVVFPANMAISFDSSKDISDAIIANINTKDISFNAIRDITVTKPNIESINK